MGAHLDDYDSIKDNGMLIVIIHGKHEKGHVGCNKLFA